MKAAGRALAAAVFGGLLGAAWIVLFYAWHPALRVEFDRDLPANVTGIYPPEHDPGWQLTFAWTGANAVVQLPGLDRRIDWVLTMRLRGGRADAAANPDLTILADGLPLATLHTASDFAEATVSIPARPDRRGLTLALHSSQTMVPGAADKRALGVMLDRLTLAPSSAAFVPRPALLAAAVASAAMGAAIGFTGVTAGSAIGGAVLLSAGIAAIAARGFAPFSGYPVIVIRLGVLIALVLAGGTSLAGMVRRATVRHTARFAIVFSASALLLKLLALLHPDIPVGDAMFHAHRFQAVLRGSLYFTSVAPGGYTFPYPPGLYLVAALFKDLVRRGPADMAILRIVTCSADAAAGLLLYVLVARGWNNRLAGAFAVAIYHLIPLDFNVLTTGNLTNAFAQALAVAAFVVMATPGFNVQRPAAGAALTIALLAAFVSHTSTLALLCAAAVAIGLLFLVVGDGTLRRQGGAVLLCTLVAAALAVIGYYGHFMDTYRTEFARIGHETATAAPAAGGRSIGTRLTTVPYFVSRYLDVPVVLFGLAGLVRLARRHGRERATLAVDGWLLGCALFLVIGILTPVDMRYYLAAIPALAVAAAVGAEWAWNPESRDPRQRRLLRLAAVLFLAGTVSTGFHNWWSVL